MKPSLLDVPFPLRGLVVNVAKDKQPPLTAAAAVNVRGYDPVAGRDRGGQRSGMTKYCSAPVSGAAAVQDLNHLSTSLSYFSGGGQSVYAPAGNFAVALANSAGTQIATTGAGTQQMHCSCWDTAGNVYVAVPTSSTHLTIYKLTAAGAQVWLTAPIPDTASSQVIGMATDGTYLYVQVRSTAGGYGLPIWRIMTSDGTLADASFWYKSVLSSTASDLTNSNNMLAAAGGTLCIGYGDNLVEFVNTATATIINAVSGTTAVMDIDTDGYNFFYVVGTTAGASTLYKFSLAGATVTGASIGNNAISVCYEPINHVVAVAFTAAGPGYSVATYSATSFAAAVATATPGAVQWQTIRPSGAGGFVLWRNNAANNMMGLKADLSTKWGPSALSEATALKSVIATNSIPAANTVPSQSNLTRLALAGGTLKVVVPPATMQSVSNTILLNPSAPVIFSTPLLSKMYYADGAIYAVYDPVTNRFDALTATAGSLPVDVAGNTGRLLCTWRQRLVIAGLQLDPSNWFMSAVGAPGDFNYSPSPPVETQAVAGNNSSTSTGQAPDVITCLIPYNDEILVLGQSNSIFQMTGDPASGGRIDLVTDQVGIAWGQPWCRDGQGVIYFLSARGSVYRFVPGALPERMSDPISELLTGTIDFSTTIARMAWDERQLGFHLFLTKQGGAAAATHYFWDQRNEAWWQDVYANNNHNPLAVHALQGFTAADRVVLIGGQDGYIRCVDCAAKDDDGTAIASSVTIGPIKDKNAVGLTLIDLQADLDTVSDAVSYAIIRGNDAQTALIAPALFSGTFNAGRNRSQAVRAHGHAAYIVLSSNTIAKRWALEYLRCKVLAAEGTDRQRMFIST